MTVIQINFKGTGAQALSKLISEGKLPRPSIKQAINELASRGPRDAEAREEVLRMLNGGLTDRTSLGMLRAAAVRHPHQDYIRKATVRVFNEYELREICGKCGIRTRSAGWDRTLEPILEEPQSCVPRAIARSELDKKALGAVRLMLDSGFGDASTMRAEYMGASCGCSAYAKITAEYSTSPHLILRHLLRNFGGDITQGPSDNPTKWRVNDSSGSVEHAFHISSEAGIVRFKLILSGVSEQTVDAINALLGENGQRN